MAEYELGRRVKTLRKRAELSQPELAERAHLSPSYISRLERGQVNPKTLDLEKVAGALGVSQIELRGDDERMIVERLGEFENDIELRVFVVGLMRKLRERRPETRRLAMAFINSIADAETDAPENASLG